MQGIGPDGYYQWDFGVPESEVAVYRETLIRTLDQKDIDRANAFAKEWNEKWSPNSKRNKKLARLGPDLLEMCDRIDGIEAVLREVLAILKKPDQALADGPVTDVRVDPFTAATRSTSD